MFVGKAKKKNIKLITHIDKNIPSNFRTDSGIVKQILINLIGNSLKYTFKGTIKVSAELLKD
jgi:signal transduction histidine kinase